MYYEFCDTCKAQTPHNIFGHDYICMQCGKGGEKDAKQVVRVRHPAGSRAGSDSRAQGRNALLK